MGFLDKLFGGKKSAEAAAFAMRVRFPDLIMEMPRGTTAPGLVLSGAVSTGETVYFTDRSGKARSCRVDVMTDESETPEGVSAGAGANVTLLLYGVKRADIEEGTLISGSRV